MNFSFIATALAVAFCLASFSVEAIAYNYDPALAMRSLTFAKTAYCNASEIQNWTCPSCPLNPSFKVFNVYHNKSDSGQAFIGYDVKNKEIVISWRGTWNILGWIYDFFTQLVPVFVDWGCPGDCRMHAGYFAMYSYYRQTIIADVTQLMRQYPGSSILVSGHSMGAGLSLPTMADLRLHFPKASIKTYNFGCPRVFSQFASLWFSKTIAMGDVVRVTHKHDPIPRTPGRQNGYLHVTNEVWYDNDSPTNFTSLCQQESFIAEDGSCIDSVPKSKLDPFDHLLYLGRSTRCNLQDPAVESKMMTDELARDPTFAAAVEAKNELLKQEEKLMRNQYF